MNKIPFNELRQVHLDFHTPDFVKVGEKFNAVEMCDTLEDSEINALCFFATCGKDWMPSGPACGWRSGVTMPLAR